MTARSVRLVAGLAAVLAVSVGAFLLLRGGGPSLDPKARASVERLPTSSQRAAGEAIVAYETATREKDAATICRRVLANEGMPSGCEQTWRPLLDEQKSIAIEVLDIEIRGRKAAALVRSTKLFADGKRREQEDTVALVRAGGGWRIVVGE